MANGTWRIARRGNAQLPLAIVAAIAIVVLLIGKAQSSLFDGVRARVTDIMAPALEVVRAPLADVHRWMGSIGEIFDVYQENLRLKEENARLRQWRNAAVVLQDRLQRYQLLLHAVPDPELSTVTARVIGRASRPFLETMILDAGSQNGVKPGQAVVDARGMIGRIFIAGRRTAWVILLTDLNSRIPITIEPGNIQAIMAGDNSPSPVIEIVSQNAMIKPGSQAVSSGDGGVLPPGLPVGTITGDAASGFRVSLLADAASSQDVEILDYKRPPENPPAPSANDLPAAAAGLAPAAPPPPTAVQQPGSLPAPVQPLGTTPAPSAVVPATGGSATISSGNAPKPGHPPAQKNSTEQNAPPAQQSAPPTADDQ